MSTNTGGHMTVFLITGANRGIGLGLCQAVVARGDKFIGTCRQSSKELLALGGQVIDNIDLGDENSFESLIKMIGANKVDVLINNAA